LLGGGVNEVYEGEEEEEEEINPGEK